MLAAEQPLGISATHHTALRRQGLASSQFLEPETCSKATEALTIFSICASLSGYLWRLQSPVNSRQSRSGSASRETGFGGQRLSRGTSRCVSVWSAHIDV